MPSSDFPRPDTTPWPHGLREAREAARVVGSRDLAFADSYRQQGAAAIIVARVGASNGLSSRLSNDYRLAAQPFPLSFGPAFLTVKQMEQMNSVVEAHREVCRRHGVRVTAFGMRRADAPYRILYVAEGELPQEIKNALTPFGADTVDFIYQDVRGA